jgi:hypothetical protein
MRKEECRLGFVTGSTPNTGKSATIALPLGVHPNAVLPRTARPAASEHPAEE